MKKVVKLIFYLLFITISFFSIAVNNNAKALDSSDVDLKVGTSPIPNLIIVSGDNQTSNNKSLSPLVVKVVDQNNNPIPGVVIDFFFSLVPNGAMGYSLSSYSIATDQNGFASVNATLGDKAGIYTVTAKTGALSVIFTETYSPPEIVTPPPPVIIPTQLIIISGDNQVSTTPALSQPFVVRVLDKNNNPIAGVKVDFFFSLFPEGATGFSIYPASAVTDKDGYITVFVTLGNKAGKYQITAKTDKLSVVFNANLEVTPTTAITRAIDETSNTISRITSPIANSEIAKVVNRPIAFMALLWALLSPLIANAPIALPWLTYFINWIMGFFQIIPRKRWGTVYDSVSRRPVSGADVSVFNTQYNQLVETQTTDEKGRFIISVKPGKYYLMAGAEKYSFPSEYDLVGYRGKPITISSSDTQIIVDIPIDPIGKRTYVRRLSFPKLSRVLDSVYYPMMILGSLISIAIAYNQYSLFNMAILGLYLFVWTSELVKIARSRTYGIVYDTGSRRPLDYAIVRIYNADNRKLLSTKISNLQGHFNILLGPGHYIMVAAKEGYQTVTHELRIRKDNYLNENIFMKTLTSSV